MAEMKLKWEAPVHYDEKYARLYDVNRMLIVDYNVYGEDRDCDILGSQLAYVLNEHASLQLRVEELEAIQNEILYYVKDHLEPGHECVLCLIQALIEGKLKPALAAGRRGIDAT
jgi:hypothetical protein